MRLNKKTISLIISFVIHILLLFIFGFYAFRNICNINIKKTPEQIVPEQERRAALHPKKSDGGTLVIFDDRQSQPATPQQPQPAIKDQPPTTKPQPTDKNQLPTTQQVPRPQETPIEEQEPPKQKEPKEEPEKIFEKKDKPQDKPIVPPEQKEPEKNLTEQDKPIVQPKHKEIKKIETKKIETKIRTIYKATEKTLTKEELKKIVLENLLKPKPAEKPEEVSLPKTEETNPKKENLLTLTKCFIDSERGNSSMLKFGQDRFPSLEDMKYICYEKQIHDRILETWKIFFARKNYQTNLQSSIDYIINKDGSIENLRLVASSGNLGFDQDVLECIKKASPFPPIPNHLGVKKYHPQPGRTTLTPY